MTAVQVFGLVFYVLAVGAAAWQLRRARQATDRATELVAAYQGTLRDDLQDLIRKALEESLEEHLAGLRGASDAHTRAIKAHADTIELIRKELWRHHGWLEKVEERVGANTRTCQALIRRN